MSIEQVIINSSPLIVLFKSQQAELLPQLFPKILVPSAVWDEITNAGLNDAASQQLSSVSWAQRVEVEADVFLLLYLYHQPCCAIQTRKPKICSTGGRG